MRNLVTASLLSIALLTGCKTTNSDGVKVYDPVKTAQVEAAIEPVAASAIRRVLQNSPDHSQQIALYMTSVGYVFCQAAETGVVDPEIIIEQIDKLTAPYLKVDYAIDIKNAAVAIYKINYANRFQAELPPDKWPMSVARVICNSIDMGLKDAGFAGVKQ